MHQVKLRKYGRAPFDVAVIHGGPGAGGEMGPVARELSSDFGVLEPIQTAISLDGQVEELKAVLESNASIPVTLIGYSWGAWLSFIIASRYPKLVKKLVLVASGPLEERYAKDITETRLSRLEPEDRDEFNHLIDRLSNEHLEENDDSLKRLGDLVSKADTYDPIPDATNSQDDLVGTNNAIVRNVWSEASELRHSGKLLDLARGIQCPVVAIHGDYDPHPAEGVENPLRRTLDDFKFVLLEKCGHTPWMEKYAAETFFRILHDELI